MKLGILLGTVLLNLIFVFTASAALPDKFFEVSPGIYRSAQPDPQDIADLKAMGIRTILNLNDDEAVTEDEQNAAAAAGITYISNPMSGFFSPDDNQVNDSLSVLSDQANYPILVHCQHGEDRTGLIVGLYRVFVEKWNPSDAYKEMIDRGFHKALFLLNRYYKKRTGFDD